MRRRRAHRARAAALVGRRDAGRRAARAHDHRPRRRERRARRCRGRARRCPHPLALEESGGVETASPTSAGHWIWTRKQADVPARGFVGGRREAARDRRGRVHRRERRLPRPAHGLEVVGRQRAHERRPRACRGTSSPACTTRPTRQRAHGVGGRRAAPRWARWPSRPTCRRSRSRRGASLEFTEWAAREEDRNMLVMRSRYRQPFGTFTRDIAGRDRAGAGLRRDGGARRPLVGR